VGASNLLGEEDAVLPTSEDATPLICCTEDEEEEFVLMEWTGDAVW